MKHLQELLAQQLLGNSLLAWLLAALAFAFTFVLLPTVRRILAHRYRARQAARKRRGEVPAKGVGYASEIVASTSNLFLLTLALWFATRILSLPEKVDEAFTFVIVLTFWFQVALWGVAFARIGLNRQRQKDGATDSARAGSFEVMLFVIRIAIFSLALLVALDNLGIEIKPLLAGLGIGGIAIALATQAVLGDLFASLSITLDKPFEVGDLLVIEDARGTVERIGIKSTRLRSLDGEQIIIANADLLKSRLRNFKRMRERRQVFTVGVTYETPRERLAQIPSIIETAVRAQPKTRFDRCHLMAFGDSSLNFETAYFVTEPDYRTLADSQHAINLALIEQFAARGIAFAYPTRRLINEERQVSDPS